MSQPVCHSLPNDVPKLQEIAKAQRTRIGELEKLVLIHQEMIRLMRIEKFGRSSEKLSDEQLSFLEEEPGVRPQEVDNEASLVEKKKRKKRNPSPGRIELPAHLPRVEETITCTPEQCLCGGCGQATHVIGFEESEVLDVKPAEYFVKVIRREKRACKRCPDEGVACAPALDRIIEKGKLSNALIIEAVIKKYRDHLPLYRQCISLLDDAGIDIHRSTLCTNVLKVGELCTAITGAMKTELFSGGYIQADETPVGVQSGRTQGKNHQAYVFQYSHPRGTAIFDFQCSRERAGPRNFLQGFKGLLQTDGYTGYNKFEESSIERIGCMAHIRRKFFDAHKAGKEDPKPMEIVRQIAKLYQIEEEARETQLNAEQRLALRQEKSAPLMDALKSRIIELRQDPSVLPKSLLGKACSYGLNQWERMAKYLEHGEAEIDNNRCENGIRPLALGRKNWLHIGSEDAGPKIAGIVSIIETCRRLEINVRDYMMDVLPGLAERKQSELPNLTPLAWKARQTTA